MDSCWHAPWYNKSGERIFCTGVLNEQPPFFVLASRPLQHVLASSFCTHAHPQLIDSRPQQHVLASSYRTHASSLLTWPLT